MGNTAVHECACDATPSQAEIAEFADGIDISPDSNLIALLQDVQDHFRYLPQGALHELSRRLRTPLSRVYGVVSFYEQFYTEPRGKHSVRCCRGTACHVRGGERVINAIEETLGIKDGETSSDMMFSFDTVACLGACALAPLAVVDGIYHGKMTPRRAEEILRPIVPAESPEGED